MKYWRYHKVPFFLGYFFTKLMENKGWKVTHTGGVLVRKYRTSTYDRELYLDIWK